MITLHYIALQLCLIVGLTLKTRANRRVSRYIQADIKRLFAKPKKAELPKEKKPTKLLRVEEYFEFEMHPGQRKAWESTKRFIAIIAGTQSGKTSFGPLWLLREIQLKGPGDYMAVGPTMKLAKKKLLPELKRLFVTRTKLFKYLSSEGQFVLTGEGEIKLFGSLTKARPKS